MRSSTRDFANALTFAAEKYFQLRALHQSLTTLDIGGGIPPQSSHYDYERLMVRFLGKVKELAKKYQQPEPRIAFELGSFVAADAGMTVFKVSQEKVLENGTVWNIIDGGLMATIPDALMVNKVFTVLAGNNANYPAQEVGIAGITCDSDDTFPIKVSFNQGKRVLMPKRDEESTYPQLVVFNDTGAYQETLSGEGGAHHCLLLQEAKVIIRTGKDKKIHVKCLPRQTAEEIRKLMGYC